MKYIIPMLMLLLALPASAHLRIPREPRAPRVNLHQHVEVPTVPSNPVSNNRPSDSDPGSSTSNSQVSCITCSAPVESVLTPPKYTGQFFVPRGWRVVIMWAFGPYKKYQLITAIDDGTTKHRGQWFRRGLFKPVLN